VKIVTSVAFAVYHVEIPDALSALEDNVPSLMNVILPCAVELGPFQLRRVLEKFFHQPYEHFKLNERQLIKILEKRRDLLVQFDPIFTNAGKFAVFDKQRGLSIKL
jgi:hypothetical protein